MAIIKNSMSSTIARDAMVLDLADVRAQANLLVEQAKKQAESLVAAARVEREKLISNAAEQGRKEGYAKGFAEGVAAGQKQGSEAGLKEQRAKLDELQASWKGALDAFVAERENLLLDARTSLVQLSLSIAERVVKRKIDTDPGVAAAQISDAMTLVLGPNRLCVSINPLDIPAIELALPQLRARLGDGSHIELRPDESISLGGCRVVVNPVRADADHATASAGTEIDAQIELQLARITDALMPGTSQAGRGGRA